MRLSADHVLQRVFNIAISLVLLYATAASAQDQAPVADGSAISRFGAPGSIKRDNFVADMRERIARGEISPFKVLLADALPLDRVRPFGGPDSNGSFGDKVRTYVNDRGMISRFEDDFSSYQTSTDPIFDRFQINMQGQKNPADLYWGSSQAWYIPSLFVAGQLDVDDPSIADPLPRWQGATLLEDNSVGALVSDLNGDGVVDTADLGILLGSFGATGANPADLNGDMVVDTADLGILLGEFGRSSGPFCLYTVDVVQTTDPDGILLAPGTITAGPAVTQTIAILNGSYSNDANVDGCPDCDFFRIETAGAVNNEAVYGDWTLTDAGGSSAGADFLADAFADTCSGYGSETVLADARSEATVIDNACCFVGAQTQTPLFAPVIAGPMDMKCDFYLTSYDSFIWFDTESSVQGLTTSRVFMGGFAPALTPEFMKYSTGGDGFINHFVFLGHLSPGLIGQYFGTASDPLVGNTPIYIPLNRWFALKIRMTTWDISVWLLDETQYAANGWIDPDSTDGSITPSDGSDDIETVGADHWFKIFPTGPAGPSPGANDGQIPDIPQTPLAAYTMDTFRFLWGGDPIAAQVPGFQASTVFFDNLSVEGVLYPTRELPKFVLNYIDDIETYYGSITFDLIDRWFDAPSSHADIDNDRSVSGSRSIRQSNDQADNLYRLEFETQLPLASSILTPWTAGVQIALDNRSETVRGIVLRDDTLAHDAFNGIVAHLLVGTRSEQSSASSYVDSRIYIRVPNPGFNPNIEPVLQRSIDTGPSQTPINTPFINVITDIYWLNSNQFYHFTFEVDAERNLVIRRDGVVINPDPVLAPALGYHESGWTAGSTSVTRLSFESGNHVLGVSSQIWVDDVTLDGINIEVADGPQFELPYVDGFEDYPLGIPIDGQGSTPFIDGTSLDDANLCIEQGLQALNATTSDLDDWCEYQIKSDAIGGITSPNDWNLSNTNLVWVRQADCGQGSIDCKDLQCFTNPNHLDEFFPNVGFFDDPDIGTKAAIGARVELVAVRNAFNPPDTVGRCDTFEWDTYDPANVFCKYTVNTIGDVDEDTAGYQDIATPSILANFDYYNSIGGKIGIGSIIAVDQIYDIDPMTGISTCPGDIFVENYFKIVDPCAVEIMIGTWTYVGDGAGEDSAMPLVCGTDIVHFNFVYENVDRFRGGVPGQAGIIDDPTGSGRGNVLRHINHIGSETGGTLFETLDSTLPVAYATSGTDAITEFDCFVTDNKSRLTINFNSPLGLITRLQLGGPDNDPENSLGETQIPTTSFALLENNPGGGFSNEPDRWFYDTGVTVPLDAWFRIRFTLAESGVYSVAMDESGVPGGDGVFETIISTAGNGSTESGTPITPSVYSINSLGASIGNDFGGDGAFHRAPIEVTHNTAIPNAFSIFPDSFCFYLIDAVDGELNGIMPPPCLFVFGLNDVLGFQRNTALPNWPNGGMADQCPTSSRFIWNNEALTGQCTGEWTWLNPDDQVLIQDFPKDLDDVASWGNYSIIPPYTYPGPASSWYIDNIVLDGAPMPE